MGVHRADSEPVDRLNGATPAPEKRVLSARVHKIARRPGRAVARHHADAVLLDLDLGDLAAKTNRDPGAFSDRSEVGIEACAVNLERVVHGGREAVGERIHGMAVRRLLVEFGAGLTEGRVRGQVEAKALEYLQITRKQRFPDVMPRKRCFLEHFDSRTASGEEDRGGGSGRARAEDEHVGVFPGDACAWGRHAVDLAQCGPAVVKERRTPERSRRMGRLALVPD